MGTQKMINLNDKIIDRLESLGIDTCDNDFFMVFNAKHSRVKFKSFGHYYDAEDVLNILEKRKNIFKKPSDFKRTISNMKWAEDMSAFKWKLVRK